MSTIEALIAIMLMLAIVAGAMSAFIEADKSVLERLKKTAETEKQQPAIALGEGRETNYSLYRRWWLD